MSSTQVVAAKASDPTDHDYQPPLNLLCYLCQYIVSQSTLLDSIARNATNTGLLSERWQHHSSIHDLFNFAVQGCHLCSLLYAQCCTETFEVPGVIICRTPLVIGIHLLSVEHNAWELTLEEKWHSDRPVTLDSCDPHESNETWRLAAGAWRTRTTASEATLDLARDWLLSCQKFHTSCSHRGYFTEARPKRLLQLSTGVDSPTVRLVDTDNIPSDSAPQYLTLSHCWGLKPLFELTKANHVDFVAGLSFHDLSQTFRDAIQITLRLGHQYLWIDALCIIQDDDEDKKAEIPRMGIIYGNSTCTIAALSSDSGDRGCFASRIPLAHMSCKIWTKTGAAVALRCTRMASILDTVHPTDPAKARYAPSLHQRAWVVQERALAPRTLYFSRVGIHWECCSSVTSEESWCQHGKHLNDDQEAFEEGRLKLGIGRLLRGDDQMAAKNLIGETGWHFQWWHLVSVYSSRKLTHMTDRWPAISGIASMFEKVANDNLIAGMWKSQITKDMLWMTKGSTADGFDRSRLDNGYPTWSWLSMNGWATLEKDVLSMESGECVLRNISIKDNSLEEVYLEVEGPMLKIPKREDLRRKIVHDDHETYEWLPVTTQIDALRRELCKGAWNVDIPPATYQIDAKDWLTQHEFWALQCTKSDDSIRMLILIPRDHSTSGWIRVGQYCFDEDEAEERVSLETIGERKRVQIY